MGMAKPSVLLLILLITFAFMSHTTTRSVAAARPLSIITPQQRYAKIFGTLGIVCKCCDGTSTENECTSTWTEPCSKLQCLPWKLH